MTAVLCGVIEIAASKAAEPAFAIWSVKRSFCAYVAALQDGMCSMSTDVRPSGGGRFVLPGEVTRTGASIDWRSSSVLTFTGHAGLLHVELRDLRLHLVDGIGTLSIRERGSDAPHLELAAAAVVYARGADVLIELKLTAAGSALFEGNYAAGASLDPLQLVLPSKLAAV